MGRIQQRLTSALVLVVAAWASPLAAQAPSPALVAFSLFTKFYLREPATFGLRNDGPTTVTLPNDRPWTIVDAGGRTIFSPVSRPTPVSLRPGASLTWRWDQRDNLGRQVASGGYTAVFAPSGLRAALPIQSQLGSRGFFTFSFPDGAQLRVFMTDAQATRDAIESFYGLGRKNIPIGPLLDDRPGHSPYDAQWSWHFDPSQLRMALIAIEVCDGHPQYVEDHLDDWLDQVGTYCPWSAHVGALD